MQCLSVPIAAEQLVSSYNPSTLIISHFKNVMTASEQLRATFNAPLYCIDNAIHPLVH